jgi:hypothetical protein
MSGIPAEELAQMLLKDKAKFWKAQEVENFLEPFQVDNQKLISILEFLVEDYIFRWLDFICLKLPVLATEKNFVNLLKKIILKIKNDMAQGNFIRALISIGEQDAKLGISLYKQMILNGDPDLLAYSSLPLGGAGKKQFDEVFVLIKEGLKNQNPNLRAVSIKTLRVIFEGSSKMEKSHEIFRLLDTNSSEMVDPVVRFEVAAAYFDFNTFKYDVCLQHLLRLAESGNSEMRVMLANTIMLRDLAKKEDEIEILSICAKDENKNVLSRVAMALARKGSEFPEKSLRIIKDWIVNNKYFAVSEIDYTAKELGKAHLDRCINEVVSWIEEKDAKKGLHFFIPILLSELSSQNYTQLLSSIKTWWSRNQIFQKIALQTIKKVLTDIYPPSTDKVDLVDSYFQLLKEIADKESIDVATVIKDESDKLFQCLRIIEELNRTRKKPVFEVIIKNLETYSSIRDFVGIKWFESMKKKNNTTHPLLLFLLSEVDEAKLEADVKALQIEADNLKRYLLLIRIQNMLTPIAFLEYLNEMLKILLSKSKKLKALRDGLRNEKQFLDTVSEIEVISSFIEEYNIDIAPELDGKKLDLKIGFNPEIYVEVISPDMFKPLKYLSGKAIGIKNRARGKILDELEHHFKNLDTLGHIPWIIVIDIGRSEMSYDFFEDALMGSERLTLLLDKTSGVIQGKALSRANDSVHDIRKATDILSAIVCYKANFGKDLKLHREGKIIPNPYAKNPASKEILSNIEKSFLK